MNFEDLNIDYLLVNSTNEFLLEYVPQEENSRCNLTGFTGSTGDALVSRGKKIKLFVDGRYHEQADSEVNHSLVDVVKLQLGQRQDEVIAQYIKPDTILGIVASKVPQARLENFYSILKNKNVEIKLLTNDIYQKNLPPKPKTAIVLSEKYSGVSTLKKLEKLSKPQLITNSEEISYICNIRDFSQNYAVKTDGKLLLLNDKTILFSDSDINGLRGIIRKPLKSFYEYIKSIEDIIYLDKSTISALDYSMIKNPKDKTSQVKMMKSIKNSAEIKHLQYAFEMTDKALMDTRNYIYKTDNLSEKDIEVALERNFKKYGAKSLSFKSIVARNQNSALAHYSKSSPDEIIKDGDLVLIDCGAYYDGGLATDITRVFVKGEPNSQQINVYTTVLKMFLNGFNYKISKDTSGYDIDNHVRKYLSKIEIDGFKFSHGLGHGIGVCVHEMPPNLSMNDCAHSILQNGMCFTIEPGLYNDKYFGVRLENSCYLENGKIKSFSNMCYEKKLIDYTILTENEKVWLNDFEVL